MSTFPLLWSTIYLLQGMPCPTVHPHHLSPMACPTGWGAGLMGRAACQKEGTQHQARSPRTLVPIHLHPIPLHSFGLSPWSLEEPSSSHPLCCPLELTSLACFACSTGITQPLTAAAWRKFLLWAQPWRCVIPVFKMLGFGGETGAGTGRCTTWEVHTLLAAPLRRWLVTANWGWNGAKHWKNWEKRALGKENSKSQGPEVGRCLVPGWRQPVLAEHKELGEAVEMRLENWQGANNALWMLSIRETIVGIFREVRHDLTYVS